MAPEPPPVPQDFMDLVIKFLRTPGALANGATIAMLHNRMRHGPSECRQFLDDMPELLEAMAASGVLQRSDRTGTRRYRLDLVEHDVEIVRAALAFAQQAPTGDLAMTADRAAGLAVQALCRAGRLKGGEPPDRQPGGTRPRSRLSRPPWALREEKS